MKLVVENRAVARKSEQPGSGDHTTRLGWNARSGRSQTAGRVESGSSGEASRNGYEVERAPGATGVNNLGCSGEADGTPARVNPYRRRRPAQAPCRRKSAGACGADKPGATAAAKPTKVAQAGPSVTGPKTLRGGGADGTPARVNRYRRRRLVQAPCRGESAGPSEADNPAATEAAKPAKAAQSGPSATAGTNLRRKGEADRIPARVNPYRRRRL